MPQSIFRESSLEKLSSPEQLDRVIKVTNSRAWLIVFTLIILVLSLLTWGVLGQIPTQINADGVMISSGGIYSVQNIVPGIVSDVQVEPDDYVQAGDVLVRFDLEDNLKEINDLTKNAGLMKDAALQKQIHQKQKEYLKNSIIRSPVEGRVIEVLAKNGDACQAGQVLIKISRMGSGIRNLEAVLYVTTEEGRNIIPGMSVGISPSTVKKEEFGQIIGQVISVSQYTVSNNAMLNILGSSELVQKFSQAGPVLEVRASLLPDDKTVSGYKWSSRLGSPLAIQNGTLCTGAVTIGNQRPIILLMPFLKKVLPMLD